MHGGKHQPDSRGTLLDAGGGQGAHIPCSALGQNIWRAAPEQEMLWVSMCHPPQPLCSSVSREATTSHPCWGSPWESPLWVPTPSTAPNPKPELSASWQPRWFILNIPLAARKCSFHSPCCQTSPACKPCLALPQTWPRNSSWDC